MANDFELFENAFYAAPPERRTAALRELVDARATTVFEAARRGPDWVVQTATHVAGLASAVLFIMVKDEEEIILQNLLHHYRLGFRRFFILDNASTDATAALIRGFREEHEAAEVFYAYDYVTGYYQADKMRALEAFMSSYLRYEDVAPEWLFFVDADEFITCCGRDVEASVTRFNHLLGDKSKNLLVLHWAQCASAEIIPSLPPRYDIFEQFPQVWHRMKPAVPKVGYRLDRGLMPLQGNHLVEAYPYDLSTIGVLAEINIYMLHFPQRTVEQLRRKVVNGARAYQAAKQHENHGGHWRTYHEWYEQHGDAALVHLLQDHIKSCVER